MSSDRLPSDSGSAAIGVFSITLHGRTRDVRTRASDRVRHRIQPQPGGLQRAPTHKCRSDARRFPAVAQCVEIGQACERLGQRGDQRVDDLPARPNPRRRTCATDRATHMRNRSCVAPYPATARPIPMCTGAQEPNTTLARAAGRTHSVSRLDRLPNDSGSAAIGVFLISLHERKHDVPHAHPIA